MDWFAYGYAVQGAKDKSQLGRGDIRGVSAPETANNASRGGALVPMLAYGIPDSLGHAAAGGAVLYGFYDQVMHIMWHAPLLFR